MLKEKNGEAFWVLFYYVLRKTIIFQYHCFSFTFSLLCYTATLVNLGIQLSLFYLIAHITLTKLSMVRDTNKPGRKFRYIINSKLWYLLTKECIYYVPTIYQISCIQMIDMVNKIVLFQFTLNN